jgi:hypothetical protein
MNEGRRQLWRDQPRGIEPLPKTRIVYAIRDWELEDDQVKMQETRDQLTADFERQWVLSASKDNQVSLSMGTRNP